MRKIKHFKKHPRIKGARIPANNIKKGDRVVMYGRGHPKGVITKVDMRYAKGGSVWYDIKLNTGKTITRRAWDIIEVYRD